VVRAVTSGVHHLPEPYATQPKVASPPFPNHHLPPPGISQCRTEPLGQRGLTTYPLFSSAPGGVKVALGQMGIGQLNRQLNFLRRLIGDIARSRVARGERELSLIGEQYSRFRRADVSPDRLAPQEGQKGTE
jgi:hypothetical protein